MSPITLEHIAHAVEQTPHPDRAPDDPPGDVLIAQLASRLSEIDPQFSPWSCVVLGFGLERINKGKKGPSQNRLDSLRTEDAECSHNSLGIRLGDEILCEFGIVDEEQWGKACKRHLVDFIAKDNLRCTYMDKPEFTEIAVLGNLNAQTKGWLDRVLIAIQANILSAATPQSPRSTHLPRL